MFDKFGEFGSFEELNKAAEGFKEEGDIDSLNALAQENGLTKDDVTDYLDGIMPGLCTVTTAAIGKLEVEKEDLKTSEIVQDWYDYIISELLEDKELAAAVRRKDKSLIGCIGALLKWSYRNKYKVDDRIIKASGISAPGVEMGIPGMATAKNLIRGYYGCAS
jgi:hypothetical protein